MRSILIFSIIFINTLFAQNIPKEELDTLSLEELMDIKIYSATKSYQRIEDIPANIIVLTRKDIEKYNYTTLDELLKHVPGLFIIDDTEHFQIGSRGSLGSSFKLMINNNPISPLRIPRAGTSNRNFFATPVESIDRIEIIKGPQAVTYGSNSMYGSINIITNDFNAKNIITLGKGNNGQEKVFARINHKQENGGFTLNTSFFNTEGIKGDLKDSFTQTEYNKNPSANKKLDGLLENEYKTVDFSHRYKNLTTDITYSKTNYGIYIEPTYREGNNVDQVEKTLAFTYEDEINENLSYKANLITSQKNYDINEVNILSSTSSLVNNHAEDKRNQIDLHLNYKLNEQLRFLLGATYERTSYDFEGTFNTIANTRKYIFKTEDIYSKIQYIYSDKFEFNAGIRHASRDDFTINFTQDNDLSNPALDQIISQKINEKNEYLPELSAVYHIDSNNHLKFLYGKANQLAYSSIEKYEVIKSNEINYLFLSRKYQINSSLFYNKAENISLFTQNGKNLPTSSIGDKVTKGFEFAVKYKPNYNIETSSSITIQKTKNYAKSTENYGPDFSPKILSKFDITYIHNKTRYSLLVDYISKMEASIKSGTNQRYGKKSNHNININTNINHKINKDLSLNLHVYNLLDRDNRVPAGSTLTSFYNGAFTKGREVLFSIKYKF
ncbi:TonB-dependent receptor plug domain-containing protein [Poseidonibacter lekithochrous]|uniref:TonB-dependent receptor plug domain-containing protein n=1 Tax=Poseidonibacter lekithochrous TaxID=1904463 RepID=UPI000D36065D|nr:TonB-dependent receptor plug domain-containing protein [Poseidonibacter lekithochrous]